MTFDSLPIGAQFRFDNMTGVWIKVADQKYTSAVQKSVDHFLPRTMTRVMPVTWIKNEKDISQCS
jgi:hypothetical protein